MLTLHPRKGDRGREPATARAGTLPPVEQPILLARGDTLVLHRAPNPGQPAIRDEHGRVLAPAHISCTLPQVFADPHQMQQVLLNLVINAEQAMISTHGRGTLILRTWHDPERGAVVLEVNDDGPGVPDDLQPKIFDPFFTTKEVGEGTGLGLAITYGIIQEHGGTIEAANASDGGAIFTALDCLSTWVSTLLGPNRGAAWVLRSANAVYHNPLSRHAVRFIQIRQRNHPAKRGDGDVVR